MAQYEFKDDIPKERLIVKTREGLGADDMNEVRWGIISFLTDNLFFSMDRLEMAEHFAY